MMSRFQCAGLMVGLSQGRHGPGGRCCIALWTCWALGTHKTGAREERVWPRCGSGPNLEAQLLVVSLAMIPKATGQQGSPRRVWVRGYK